MLIEYRKATVQDLQTVKEIARRVILNNYKSFLGDMAVNQVESGMADKEVEDGLDTCTVMFSNEEMIGFAITKEDLLHLVMIDTLYQNKGFGSKLLSQIENDLFRKYNLIRLQSFKENNNRVAFYQKNGWTTTDEVYVQDMGVTMLSFEKTKSVQEKILS